MLTYFFGAFVVGCRHFDWLDNLREHIGVDEIIRVQVMSERDAEDGDLEWAGVMEECKRELSCVCQKMAEAVGWQPERPCRPHAPKPGEQREKAMRTTGGGGICLHQAMRIVKRKHRREGEHVLATLG